MNECNASLVNFILSPKLSAALFGIKSIASASKACDITLLIALCFDRIAFFVASTLTFPLLFFPKYLNAFPVCVIDPFITWGATPKIVPIIAASTIEETTCLGVYSSIPYLYLTPISAPVIAVKAPADLKTSLTIAIFNELPLITFPNNLPPIIARDPWITALFKEAVVASLGDRPFILAS